MKKLLFLYLFFFLQGLSADWHTVYAHGIVDNQTQMQRFIDAISTPNATALAFCDAQKATNWGINGCLGSLCQTILGKNINRANMHMGQGDDIEKLHQKLTAIPTDENIILYGCSRGAATIINTLAEHNSPNVQAVVLDATPASMPDTIKPLLANFGINPDYASTIFTMLFPCYPKDSQTPLQAIKNITNKNLPILLIHSATDKKVPVHHSLQLYQEFLNRGFTNVALVILPEGNHSYILQNENMKPLYLQAVHSFYKKYNLPYNSAWAQKDFDQIKYRPESLNYEIECYQRSIETIYKKTLILYARASIIACSILATLLALKKF